MKTNWNKRFMDLAAHIAAWSKDPTKVGAVIVDNERRVLSMGYNGFPSGCNDDILERHERPAKYMYTEHAERNAIYNAGKAGVKLKGSALYCTMFPCADCARAIIQSGISTVTVKKPDLANPVWSKHFEVAYEMMEEAGVKVNIYSEESII
jgi:dCMP deaminase